MIFSENWRLPAGPEIGERKRGARRRGETVRRRAVPPASQAKSRYFQCFAAEPTRLDPEEEKEKERKREI